MTWFAGTGFIGTPGGGELLILFAIILILFGPRKLPEAARFLGRALNELRRASQDFRDQVMQVAETDESDTGRDAEPAAEEGAGEEEAGRSHPDAEGGSERKDARDELAG